MQLYQRAADFLEEALLDPKLAEQREAIHTSLKSYRVRINAIEQQLSGQAPVLPRVSDDGTVEVERAARSDLATGSEPSVMQVGWQAVKVCFGYCSAIAVLLQCDFTSRDSKPYVGVWSFFSH